MRFIDIAGMMVGKLTVMKRGSKNFRADIFWVCVCDCGNVKEISGYHLRRGSIKSCGCLKRREDRNHPLSKCCGLILGSTWARIKRGASIRGIEFKLTAQEAWDLFQSQDMKCALSGLDINLPVNGNDHSHTASLDRIDSDLPYVSGNVQWVHKKINIMKNRFNQDDFISMCRFVSKFCDTNDVCEIKR